MCDGTDVTELITALALVGVGGVGVAAAGLPLADAGLDQEVTVGTTVYLDAGGSTDPDGGSLRYEWRVERPNGSTVELEGSGPRASFGPTTTGRYEATVTVTDDDGETATDTLYVDVDERVGPFVNLSGPKAVFVDSEATYRVKASIEERALRRMHLYVNGTERRTFGLSGDEVDRNVTLNLSGTGRYRAKVVVRGVNGRVGIARTETASVRRPTSGDGGSSSRPRSPDGGGAGGDDDDDEEFTLGPCTTDCVHRTTADNATAVELLNGNAEQVPVIENKDGGPVDLSLGPHRGEVEIMSASRFQLLDKDNDGDLTGEEIPGGDNGRLYREEAKNTGENAAKRLNNEHMYWRILLSRSGEGVMKNRSNARRDASTGTDLGSKSRNNQRTEDPASTQADEGQNHGVKADPKSVADEYRTRFSGDGGSSGSDTGEDVTISSTVDSSSVSPGPSRRRELPTTGSASTTTISPTVDSSSVSPSPSEIGGIPGI